MKITESSPVLMSKTRTGKDKCWQGHVTTDGTMWFTQSSYWQIGKDGKQSKIQFSDPYEATPKNVGKTNETSAQDQAHFEFESMVQKQRDKGYTEAGTVSKIRPLPMLAVKFSERGHKLKYPVWVQPKYNGQRMLHDATDGWSRGGKDIIPECIEHIRVQFYKTTLFQDAIIMDGELMLPNNVLLQETMETTTKYVPGVSEQLIFRVYDLLLPDKPFSERYKLLQKYVTDINDPTVVIAPTYVAHNVNEVMSYHKQFVADGYEGTIIRDDSGGYITEHRANQLQKYKDFVDAEFRIIDVKEGDGKFKGAAIFICDNGYGDDFKCTPEGTMEYRRELYANRKSLIGKYLTVRYQELSKVKKPLFPVGVSIRDTKDGGY